MKKGFALLETIIVITFVTVSLLLLYGTFTSMIDNSRRNLLYDDAANIYKMYFLKEYLELNQLEQYMNGDIVSLSCDDFQIASCSVLFDDLGIDHLYLVRYGLRDYDESVYFSSFNRYLDSLSNNEEYDYILVGEFLVDREYQYASIGVMHE